MRVEANGKHRDVYLSAPAARRRRSSGRSCVNLSHSSAVESPVPAMTVIKR